MADRLRLAPKHRRVLEELLREHLPGVEVWAYGSRVSGKSHDGSDLDLVLRGPGLKEIPIGQLWDFDEAVRESTIPFLVEARDWTRLPERFHGEIGRDYVVLVENEESAYSCHDWPVMKVEDIAEKVGMGPFGSSIKVSTFVSNGIPVISGQHLHSMRVNDSVGFNFVTTEHAQRLANANVFPGDLIFTHAGNIGQVAYIPEDSIFPRYIISQRQFYLRCNQEKVLPEFIAMYFKSPEGQHQLLANSSQVGVPSIARPVTYLRSIELPIPSLSEQRAIAHILGTLDDKIELNRRMKETLEAMARALFKSWFVDFDPVRAKMEGRDTDLPQSFADLFPDRLVDSEIGEIPEGWKIRSLGEVVDTIKGRSYRSKELENSKVALVTLKSFARGGGYRADGLKSFSGTYKPDQVVRPGEIVVACTDVTQKAEIVGRPAIVQQSLDFEILVASLDTLIVRPKDDRISTAFLYFLMKDLRFAAHTYAHCTGTTVLHLTKEAVPTFRFAFPPSRLMNSFYKFANPFLIRQDVLLREADNLSAMRDSLLPRLISGEIRLNDAERYVEAAL